MERFPTLKVVTHHLGGGMLPFYSGRFNVKLPNLKKNLKKPVSESFSRIYGDTAVDGTAAALPCGHAFFGTERMLFGTDYPQEIREGGQIASFVKEIRNLPLSQKQINGILSENGKKLLKGVLA